jgi:regulator of RNase E activity RraA
MGGIMQARMQELGAIAIVVDGRVRDLDYLSGSRIPIFSRGTSVIGAGAETKFHAKEVAIQIGDVRVEPGDFVLVDEAERGVVVVPRGRVEEVLALCERCVKEDEKVLEAVERGRSVDEAFRKYRK